MKKIVTVEEQYEEYLKADDKIKEVDGEKFYKAVSIEKYNFTHLGPTISIVLPNAMFEESHDQRFVENERGESFKLHGPGMIRFANGIIPEWYRECRDYFIKEEDYDHPLTDIGQYFISR